MKKFFSIMLAAAMTLTMSVAAFAEGPDTNTDMSAITITKDYEATNQGTRSPAETFAFTIRNESVTDAADGVTKENMPTPSISTISYNAGEAGSLTKTKHVGIILPTYTSVGVYTYIIKETAGTTAGVTYYPDDIKLVVTVQQGEDGKIRVAAVHTEGEGEAKADNFPNVYSAGSLAVKKEVTGNMGDQTKEFNVTVEFTAPDGKTVNEKITYMDGNEVKTIAPNWTDDKASAVITLKHNETVTFTNIPYGVTYKVVESDYTDEGYDTPNYSLNGAVASVDPVIGESLDSASENVVITNNKGVAVDTGIGLDSLPYMMLLVGAMVGLGVVVLKKRQARED